MEFLLFTIMVGFLTFVFTGAILSTPEPSSPPSKKLSITECKNCGAKEASTVCSYCASPK